MCAVVSNSQEDIFSIDKFHFFSPAFSWTPHIKWPFCCWKALRKGEKVSPQPSSLYTSPTGPRVCGLCFCPLPSRWLSEAGRSIGQTGGGLGGAL